MRFQAGATPHNKSHGLTNTKEYSTWCRMKTRVKSDEPNKKKSYKDKGIIVCDEWANSFERFLNDIGYAPSKDHTLERIDNDGNYCKENCKWATKKEQCQNKSSNRFIEHNGIKDTLTNWEKRLGFKRGVLQYRLDNNWNIESAMTTPSGRI
jgi:hypothetical protein